MEYLQYEEEELKFTRDQFTFYRSFLKGIRRIRDMQERGEVYDAICDYALNRVEPDYESMTAMQLAVMDLIFPVLDSARKKALAGKQGGSKSKAKSKQTESKGEREIEKEIEKEKDIEIDIETETESEGNPLADDGGGGFHIFWNSYPKKVCKEQAEKAFEKVTVPLSVLQQAIQSQQKSIQWTRENGRYIPNPATWLTERRWEDELPQQSLPGNQVMASGTLGEAEQEAIRRILSEG